MTGRSEPIPPHLARLRAVEGAAILVSLVLGWAFAGLQLRAEGWGTGSAWMVALAAVATAGGLAWVASRRAGGGRVAVALLLVAASPVVFAYPVTLLVLGLAAAELVLAVRAGRARARTGGELVGVGR